MKKNSKLNKNSEFNLALSLFNRIKSWEKTAYYYNDRPMTFAELRDRSERFATSLRLQGIENRDRVLIFMNDTPSFFVVFLGVLQVGAIPIPLNPKSTKSSMSYYVSDSGASAVIGESESLCVLLSATEINQSGLCLIVEDIYSQSIPGDFLSLRELVSNERSDDYAVLRDSDITFMQYTSGTTGNPKAVMHNGAGMLAHANTYGNSILNIAENDIVYSVAKVFFGFGLGNSLFLPFYHNLSAVIDSRWPTVELIVENLKSYRPSVFFSVPKIYSELLEFSEELEHFLNNNLRLISGGSPLPSSLHTSWKQQFGLTIYDGVGTTEMGHIFLTTLYQHSKGICVPGYEVKLVDIKYDNKSRSKQGVLLVKGPSQSLGYYNNKERTMEKFDSDGWYRTGDIFSQDEEGFYKFESREDDLFKVKGRWVCPNEMESFVLSNFKTIVDAALIKSNQSLTDEELTLFVVTISMNEKNSVFFEEVKALLKDSFEPHQIPKHIFILDEMPRNENGKLMRAKLVQLASSRTSNHIVSCAS